MAKPPVHVKYKVSSFEWFIGIGTTTPLWIVEFVLSITGVGEIVSEIIGVVQDGIVGYFYFRTGMGGKNATQKLTSVATTEVVDIIPWINDIPCAPLEILYLRYLSRKDDREAALAHAQAAEQAAEEEIEREAQYQALVERRLALQQAANDNIEDDFEYAEAA